MTAVLDYVIFALIGLSIFVAVFFIVRAIRSRSQSSREAYGVGQQEARRSMRIDLVRGAVFIFVGLILWGVYGLNVRPTESFLEQPTPATLATATTRASTAAPSPTATLVVREATSEPTEPAPTESASPVPEPTEAPPTPAPRTATVISEVGVWLRGAPNTDGVQLEWVLNGTVLTLLPGRETADNFEWQQVRSPDGNEGWVATDFIAEN